MVCAGVIFFRPLGGGSAAIALGCGVFALAAFLLAHNHLWLKFVSTEALFVGPVQSASVPKTGNLRINRGSDSVLTENVPTLTRQRLLKRA